MNDSKGKQMYRHLNNELRRETDKARGQWLKEQCEEIELLEKRGRIDMMYAKVRELNETDHKKVVSQGIDTKSGDRLTDASDIQRRWVEHIEELYDRDAKPDNIYIGSEEMVDQDDMGPPLLSSEIWKAVEEIRGKRACGIDDLPIELFKNLDGQMRKELERLCVNIYETGDWPKDFLRTVMIPIPKKNNATKCSDFRTISLICHASKIILKIITRRMVEKAESFLGWDQFGFRTGLGTREAIAVMRTLCERSLEVQKEVNICFVDYEKAFDRVNWVKLLDVLKSLGVDWKDRRLIRNLYLGQTVSIRTAQGDSEPGSIGRGVRQGCPLSPILFNVYAEAMVQEAFIHMKDGIIVGGRTVNSVRFADDKAIVSHSEEGLQRLMDSLVTTGEDFGIRINITKTKVMKVTRSGGD